MDFSLSEEQTIIQHTARALFSRECPLEMVRAAWDDPAAAESLWRDHLSGWLELAGQSMVDGALFMQEYGKALVPGVYFSSLLARLVADASGQELRGSATVAVAGADGYWQPHGGGDKHYVPCAGQVDSLVLVGGSPQAPCVAIVPAADVPAELVDQMDRTRPMYRMDANGAASGTPVSPEAWTGAVQRALVLTSAELVGIGRYLLDSAVAYAKDRQQFGRPIGSFQGLQWKLVDVALALERATAAVAYAAMCVDAQAPETVRAVHSAKLEAGSAARQCARTSLQVHGGIGYTWEAGLHFWLRRAYAGDAFMGSADYHAGCLADELFAA